MVLPQLERLVARLLCEGRAHLPEEYPTPTRMIVEGPQKQPSSFSSSSSSSHEPPTKPSHLPKGEEQFSGSLSTGPTPAPTPEVQRTTRDPSDGSSRSSSSATSEPRSPLGKNNWSDDAGAENDNTATASCVADQDVCGWDDDEVNSRGEGGEEGDAREREEKGGERAPGSGARDSATTEDSRKEAKEPTSSVDASLESDVKHEQHETLVEKKENEEFHDHGQLDDEVGGYGQHRKTESMIEAQPTSSKSFTTVEASATAADEGPDREKSPGDSTLGEDDTLGKEKLEPGEEGEEERNEEGVPEIEDEDDGIPEDVESEELYETGSSHADAESKGEEHRQTDGGDNEPRSKGDGSSNEVGDTENDDANPFTSSRDAGTAVEKTEAVSLEDHYTESERASPRSIPGGESNRESLKPPPVASPMLQTSRTAAVGTNPPSRQGSSQEGRNSPPLSSPLAPSRGSAPAPSSPEPGAGIGTSPLAGLPLPPMGGGRQRLGLLGSLPPVGGRGLPSLALPLGKKTMNVREEGGKSGGVGREGVGESEDDAKGAPGVTDTLLVSGGSSPLMSPRWSPTRSPIADKDSAASRVQEKVLGDDTADQDGDGGDVLDELARLSLTRGEGEKDKEDEEATLRARLGFGEDEEDEPERNNDGGSLGGRESSESPSPGSPKQHQGQEEENAGRVSAPDPRGGDEDEGGAPPTGGGAGGDYFGDTDEASSVGEDISFEQESVDGAGGGGESGSDDYFS